MPSEPPLFFLVSSLVQSPTGRSRYCSFPRMRLPIPLCPLHCPLLYLGFCPSLTAWPVPCCYFQLLSPVQLFLTAWTAACEASLSFTISWSLLNHSSITMPGRSLCTHRSNEMQCPCASSLILSICLFQSDDQTGLYNHSHFNSSPQLDTKLLKSGGCISFSAVSLVHTAHSRTHQVSAQ